MKCPKCGSSYSSASNFESHWRGSHFGPPPLIAASNFGRSYEVGIEPDEQARADTPAGRILHLGQPEESPVSPAAKRVIKYQCIACLKILDARDYPNLTNEHQLMLWHEAEFPECAEQRRVMEEQTQKELEEKLEFRKEGKACPVCNKKLFSAYEYKRHIAKHDNEKLVLREARERADVVVDQIKEYLRENPNAGPTEIARALNLAYSTVWAGLERIRRNSGAQSATKEGEEQNG